MRELVTLSGNNSSTSKHGKKLRARRRTRVATAAGLAVVGSLCASNVSQATTYYWDIDGTGVSGPGGATPNGTWNGTNAFFNPDPTGGNANGAAIASPTVNDDLVFAAGTTATGSYDVTVSGSQFAKSILMEDGTGGTANRSFLIGVAGSTLTLGSGGVTYSNGLNNNNFTVPIILGASTVTFTNNNANGIGIAATISDGGLGYKFIAAGANRINFNAANTYTGGTDINNGSIRLGVGNAFSTANGANNIVTVNSAGTTLGATSAINFNVGLTAATIPMLAGNSTGVIDLSNASGAGFAVQLTIGATNGNYADKTYFGALKGVGSIVKSNVNTLTLAGTNNYTGETLINQGTLQFAKTASLYSGATGSWTPGSIKVASGATLAINVGGSGEFTTGNVTTLLTNLGGLGGAVGTGAGLSSGSTIAFDTTNAGGTFTVANSMANSTGAGGGPIGVTKLGTGTLVLSGTNSYTGKTTVLAGTLKVNAGSLDKDGPADTEIAAMASTTGHTTPFTNAAKFTQDVTAVALDTDNYIGIGSTVTAATSSIAGFQSTAQIIDGGNNTVGGSDTGVSMQWRTRSTLVTSRETPGNSTPSPIGQYAPTAGLASDIVNITGMVNSGAATGQTDLFVLQMTYDEATVAASLGVSPTGFSGAVEATYGAANKIQLVWLNEHLGGTADDRWELAVIGNIGGTASFDGNGAYNPLTDFSLGKYGVDTANNVVWAVLNHNSQFAVIPEPSSITMIALGALGVFSSRRRRRTA